MVSREWGAAGGPVGCEDGGVKGWLVGCAVLLLVLAGCGAAPTAAAPAGAEGIGFRGSTVDGAPFDGAQLAGAPVVLWFWAPY